MKRFQNILAGVDLASGDQLVCPELSAPNREVVRQAIRLAAESGAKRLICWITKASPMPSAEAMPDLYFARWLTLAGPVIHVGYAVHVYPRTGGGIVCRLPVFRLPKWLRMCILNLLRHVRRSSLYYKEYTPCQI